MEELETDLYTCGICFEDMVDNSRMLQCNHTFCEGCLKDMLDKVNKTKIKCPTCRRVTEVADGNVKKLPFNFNLVKMKERENQMVKIAVRKCEICVQNDAKVRCLNCNQKLCMTCKKNEHDKLNGYGKHNFLELCEKHKQVLAKMCVDCVKVVCAVCVMKEHNGHADSIKTLHKGCEELKDTMSNTEEKLMKQFKMVETSLSKTQLHVEKTKILKRYISKYLSDMENTKIELDKVNIVIASKLGVGEHAVESLTDVITKTKTTAEHLAVLSQANYVNYVSNYKKTKEEAENTLQQMERALELSYSTPSVTLLSSLPKKLISYSEDVDTAAPALNIKNIVSFESISDMKLQCPDQIVAMGSKTVIFTDWKMQNACCIDQAGNLIVKYCPKEISQQIRGIHIANGRLVISQPSSLTSLALIPTSENPYFTMKPDIEKISKVVLLEETNYIISSFHSGIIYEYDSKDNSVVMKVDKLQGPSYISIQEKLDEKLLVVTEKNKHCISVFDSRWQKVLTIGEEGSGDGQLKWPNAAVVEEATGCIIVADWGNNRICKFSAAGKFICHLLTAIDGLKGPMCVCLVHKGMWVTEYCNKYAAVKYFSEQ